MGRAEANRAEWSGAGVNLACRRIAKSSQRPGRGAKAKPGFFGESGFLAQAIRHEKHGFFGETGVLAPALDLAILLTWLDRSARFGYEALSKYLSPVLGPGRSPDDTSPPRQATG
jgi:hypothetical protein